METTKKISDTPLTEELQDDQTFVIVDAEGNVSRIKLPQNDIESISDDYIGGLE